jgi:hypothetical protein
MPLYLITNDAGRSFNVRVVRKGDTYGLNDCLTYGSEAGPKDPASSIRRMADASAARGEVLVEFYDATYANHPGFGPRGQFVARYYLSTLKAPSRGGLCLQGGIPEWVISGRNLTEAVAYAVGSVQEAA